MRILAFLNNQDVKAYEYYRIFLPVWAIGEHCDDIEIQLIDSVQPLFFNTEQTDGYDFYAMSRMYGGDGEEFVRLVHDTGAQIVWDADDDLTDDARWVAGHGDAFKEMLDLVDHVTVTTPKLAERLGMYTQRPPVVLPNYIDAQWMRLGAISARRDIPGVTIGFAGTQSHWGDWYLAVDAFKWAAEQEGVAPVVMGYVPPYLEDVPGLNKIKRAPYAFYPQALSQFDVLMCALDTKQPGPAWSPEYEPPGGNYQWNESKSAIKALEAMAVGAVAMCSDIPAYRALYEAGAPIILVEHADGWNAEVERIIEDTFLRNSLKVEGFGWVAEHRNIRNTGWELWADYYRGLGAPSSL